MAGLIFRKVRGLRAKFWTKKEIFLNRLGLRVEYRKLRGLFNKKAARRGTRELGPSDLDLVVGSEAVG